MPPRSGSILFDMQVTLEPPFLVLRGLIVTLKSHVLCAVFFMLRKIMIVISILSRIISFFSPHPFCQSVAKGARS